MKLEGSIAGGRKIDNLVEASGTSVTKMASSAPQFLPSYDSKPICEWTPNNVVEWMTRTDMENLVDYIKSQKIGGAALLQLQEESLERIGITDDGQKRSLMEGINKLKIMAVSDSEGSSTESDECTSDISEHSMHETTISTIQKCDKCSKQLRGVGVVHCTACGLNLHKKCTSGKVHPCNSHKLESRLRVIDPYMGLIDLASQVESSKYKTVPDLLYICAQEVERQANDNPNFDVMAVYKSKDVSSESICALKRQLIEAADKGDMFNCKITDVELPVIGGLVKKYLRELSNPLIPTEYYRQFIQAAKTDNTDVSIERLSRLLDAIPECNNTTLDFLLAHLCRLLTLRPGQSQSSKLAQVFCHIILRPDLSELIDLVENTQYHLIIIQRLLIMQDNNNNESKHSSTSHHLAACEAIEASASFDRVPPLPSELHSASNDRELNLPLEQCPWYWGEMSREEAHDRMAEAADGSFLVRNATSHSENGDYTLVLRMGGSNLLIKILHRNNAYGFAEPCDFRSVQALVHHYRRNSLAEYNAKLNISLQHVVSKEAHNVYVPDPSTLIEQLRKIHMEHIQKSKQMDSKLSEQKQLSFNMQHLYQALDTFRELGKISEEQINSHATRFALADAASGGSDNCDGLRRQLAGIRKNKESLEDKISEGSDRSRSLLAEINACRQEIRSLTRHSEQIVSQLLRQGMSRSEIDAVVSMNDDARRIPHHDEKTWLVRCSRMDTPKYLDEKADGTFLIRPSSQDNPYTLSIVYEGKIEHCKIFQSPLTHLYGFAEPYLHYQNVTELVLHYKDVSLSLHNPSLGVCLSFPVHSS